MVGFRDHGVERRVTEARLETPRRVGYKNGMSATHLIGNRLALVYEVAADLPGEMGAVLRDLDGKPSRVG